jgi:hypothetical protein
MVSKLKLTAVTAMALLAGMAVASARGHPPRSAQLHPLQTARTHDAYGSHAQVVPHVVRPPQGQHIPEPMYFQLQDRDLD